MLCCLGLFLLLQSVTPPLSYAAPKPEAAPDFELYDLNAVKHRLSDYRGKVVLLNFWASWCPECLVEMPSLNALYEKFKKEGLVVLGITADRKKEPVLDALRKTPVGFPLLLESGGSVFIRKYTVIGFPTTVVIDKNGFIAERIVGRTDFTSSSFMTMIGDLLGRKGQI